MHYFITIFILLVSFTISPAQLEVERKNHGAAVTAHSERYGQILKGALVACLPKPAVTLTYEYLVHRKLVCQNAWDASGLHALPVYALTVDCDENTKEQVIANDSELYTLQGQLLSQFPFLGPIDGVIKTTKGDLLYSMELASRDDETMIFDPNKLPKETPSHIPGMSSPQLDRIKNHDAWKKKQLAACLMKQKIPSYDSLCCQPKCITEQAGDIVATVVPKRGNLQSLTHMNMKSGSIIGQTHFKGMEIQAFHMCKHKTLAYTAFSGSSLQDSRAVTTTVQAAEKKPHIIKHPLEKLPEKFKLSVIDTPSGCVAIVPHGKTLKIFNTETGIEQQTDPVMQDLACYAVKNLGDETWIAYNDYDRENNQSTLTFYKLELLRATQKKQEALPSPEIYQATHQGKIRFLDIVDKQHIVCSEDGQRLAEDARGWAEWNKAKLTLWRLQECIPREKSKENDATPSGSDNESEEDVHEGEDRSNNDDEEDLNTQLENLFWHLQLLGLKKSNGTITPEELIQAQDIEEFLKPLIELGLQDPTDDKKGN